MGTNKISYKLRTSSKQKITSAEQCNKNAIKGRKPIYCFNNKTTYVSIAEAGRLLKLNKQAINKVVKGKAIAHKGFRFKYVEKIKKGILDDRTIRSYCIY